MKNALSVLLSIVFCIACLTSCTSDPDVTWPDDVTTTETEVPTEPEETTKESEDQAAMDMVDYIVSVPADRAPVILQLTDTQIIDSAQCRTEDRISESHMEFWGPDKKEDRCYSYLREIITSVNPDLILLTGDIVYGEFDDSGASLVEFVAFMESFGIPWAPVFGNHENESAMGADWQCEQFEQAEHCLFVQRALSGNGNYTVGIEQGGKLTRVFFMMDSNGCSNASPASLELKNFRKQAGFTMKQTAWYKALIKDIKAASPDTKLSFAFHIQPDVMSDVFALYGTDGSTPVHIDYAENRREGEFGYIGYPHETFWDANRQVWKSFLELGVDSVFMGHEHANSCSIVYEGIRLQFGMKSSAYDNLNYVDASGNVQFMASVSATPLIGGSVFGLDAEGNITDPYIYYCKGAGAEIDWESMYAQKQPETQPVCARIEFDSVSSCIGSTAEPLFTPGTASAWNNVANIDNGAVEFLKISGWVSFLGDSVGEFGYQIDDGETVYASEFARTPEQGVIDAAAGRPASRYSIMVPVSDVSGEHTVRVYVRDANGNAELIREFKLIKAQ